MKTLIEKVKDSVEAIGIQFEYGNLSRVNDVMDNHNFDNGKLGYCLLIGSGNCKQQNGMFYDGASIFLYIVDKTQFDVNSIENERIIQGCMQKVFQWLNYCKRGADFTIESVDTTQRVYQKFDAIVTGYAVGVTITDNKGYGSCDFA